jgi:hypothetical protein
VSAPRAALASLWIQLGTIGFVVGTPLIAGCSFGSEFQHRTLALLLSQPLDRTRLWFEKWLTLVAVAAVVGGLQLAVLRDRPFGPGSAPTALFVLAMVCSAPLWTLVTRSTIGGTTFSGGALMTLELAVGFARHWLGIETGQRVVFADTPILNALRLAYAAVTFAAGLWVFTRFETTGSPYEQSTVPEDQALFWPRLLRVRRRGVLRNLLRKEVRLQRPTYLIAACFAAAWLVTLALFRVKTPRYPGVEVTFAILLAVYVPVAIVLAGAISAGEEAALGIHDWHLTLPVRARTQWGVKIATAYLIAAVFVLALPLGLRELTTSVLDPALGTPPVRIDPLAIAIVSALVAVCFWGGTLFGDTLRAVVASGLMLFAAGLCGTTAIWVAERSRVGVDLLARVMVAQQLPPDAFWVPRTGAGQNLLAASAVAAVGVLILYKSFQAFSRMRPARRTVVGQLTSVFATTLIVWSGSAIYINGAYGVRWNSAPVQELNASLESLSSVGALPSSATVQDLDRTGRLSASTRRWLAGASIRVNEESQRYAPPARTRYRVYNATVQFPNGRFYGFRFVTRTSR